MHRTEQRFKHLAALAGVLLVTAAEAVAQDAERRIVVSIPDHKLAILQAGRVVKIYATAVGAARTPSPTGTFSVVQRIPNPTWYGKGKVIGPGKANPLGTRWLGLSQKGYGIHGTNQPASIGHNASHGCIRLRNRDVEELFTMVEVGDPVEMYGSRTPELDQIFGTVATDQHAGLAAGQ